MNAKPNGDQGQRYEIRAHHVTRRKDVAVGWTNNPSGGEILRMAQQNFLLENPSVVDRTPGIERLIDDSRFQAGCRKCVEQIYCGHDHCSYCQMRFPLKVKSSA